MGWFFVILKPVVVCWLGLKFLDDFSVVTRVIRLGFARSDGSSLCNVCDDLMADILVQGGVEVLPCRIICLGVKPCVQMCEHIKDISQTSTKYPCVAAGYCDATEENLAETDIDCRVGRFFSCGPSKYCHRVRKGIKWSCKLRPGIGRWIGLQNSFRSNAGAMAVALLAQPHCSDPDAGPYCISEPVGLGIICEILVYILSVIYGGYQSIIAIESPGGDDDTQWLTFWIILGFLLSLEKWFIRPILSMFAFYYETKLAIVIWLLYFQGADKAYRTVRKFLLTKKLLEVYSKNDIANDELVFFEENGGALVQNHLKKLRGEIRRQKEASLRRLNIISIKEEFKTGSDDDDDDDDESKAPDWEPIVEDDNINQVDDSEELLHKISTFLLSSEGLGELIKSNAITTVQRDALLAKASGHLNFRPKYLYILNISTAGGKEGELPPMDANGLADPYIICRLVNERSTSTKGMTTVKRSFRELVLQTVMLRKAISGVQYRTKRPKWNDLLELSLYAHNYIDNSTGIHSDDQTYLDNIRSLSLQLEVWDKDMGFWGMMLRFSPFVLVCLIIVAIIGYVTALTDRFTPQQITIFRIIYVFSAVLLILSFVMSVIRKADDDPVGQCTIPMRALMEKRKHNLRLKLNAIETKSKKLGRKSFSSKFIKEYRTPTNSVGGYGVLNATFMLTEK